MACCPLPPCKPMGFSHHADLDAAQRPLPSWVASSTLRVASFLLCCILHFQILAKKNIQLQKRPFHRFCSKLVPKVAHIDSTPDLTQITLYTEPMLSRASSQANWISSSSAHPSDMDVCSHGRAVPQHSWDVSQPCGGRDGEKYGEIL